MGNCYLFGASKIENFDVKLTKDDCVIAVDGGYDFLVKNNIEIDYIIGDFDSVVKIPNQNVIKLPKEKDQTDMLAAIEIGIEKGYQNFYIYGGLGGRLSHCIANIQLLIKLACLNLKGYLFDNKTFVTVIKNDEIELCKDNCYLSIFALDEEAEGVTLQGVKYPLFNYTLKDIYPIGISNEFIGKVAEIKVTKGTLLIIKENIS